MNASLGSQLGELHFHSEDVPSPLSTEAEETARQGLIRLVIDEAGRPGALNIIFCSDPYLQEIHSQYLKKEDFTDIITFDHSAEGLISGDLFISVDRVTENANSYASSFQEELHRVMAHGVLHLLGYGDKSASEKKVMREKEQEGLRLLGF